MSKAYEIITNKIIELLESNIVPWKQPWINRYPESVHGHKYSGINFFILSCIGMKHRDHRWITYNQARKLGGNIKKGETGIPVVFWSIFEKENRAGEVEEIPILRYYTVFNVEQTENCTIPNVKTIIPEFVPQDRAENIINSADIPEIKFGGNRAYYNCREDYIRMPYRQNFESENGYYSTVFHEIAHCTGHQTRLARNLDITDESDYAYEELTAEMTSAYLMAECRMSNTKSIEQNSAYIKSWLEVFKQDKQILIKSASIAQKACDYILGNTNVTDETKEVEAAAA